MKLADKIEKAREYRLELYQKAQQFKERGDMEAYHKYLSMSHAVTNTISIFQK